MSFRSQLRFIVAFETNEELLLKDWFVTTIFALIESILHAHEVLEMGFKSLKDM